MASAKDADGRIYGLPNNSNCLALLCNMDILKAAGVENPPTTWEELREVCEKTTNPDEGVYGLAMIDLQTKREPSSTFRGCTAQAPVWLMLITRPV